MNDGGLPGTARFVAAEVEAGLLMTGAQICVIDADGRERQVATGDAGGRIDLSTVFRAWCATKPLTAIALARLVEAGLIGLDEPLRGYLPGVASLASGETTLRHVLAHTAGLHVPTAPRMELLDPGKRRQWLLETQHVPVGWRIGSQAAYSEVLGWHVLGELIEVLTQEPLQRHLRRSVLDPLDLHDTWIGMSKGEYESNVGRIGVNYDLRSPKAYPLLFERAERVCCEVNCAYGGYTTARDLARFYALLISQLHGAANAALPSQPVLAEFCSPARAAAHDPILRRECTFALGLMCELEAHHYGPYVSDAAFGHSGWAGSAFAFADPTAGIAAAVITNGILPDESAFLSRLAVIRAIYTDCGLPPLGGSSAKSVSRSA